MRPRTDSPPLPQFGTFLIGLLCLACGEGLAVEDAGAADGRGRRIVVFPGRGPAVEAAIAADAARAAVLRRRFRALAVADRRPGRAELRAAVDRMGVRSERLRDGNDYHRLRLEGWHGRTRHHGRAELPVYTRLVRIPAGAAVEVAVDAVDWRELPGAYDLAPVQPELPELIGHDDEAVPFVKDEAYYARDGFGDEPVIDLVEQVVVRRRHFAVIAYRPLAYNPKRRRLRAAVSVAWRLVYDPAAVEAPPAQPDRRPAPPPAELDIRPEAETAPPPADDGAGTSAPLPGPATEADPLAATARDADYLVIAADAFVDEAGPLARWHHRRGLRTYLAGYPTDTGSGTDAIAAYIQDAYDNDRLTAYVLIVGDHENVPSVEQVGHPYHGSSHVWHSDKPYARVDGDDEYPDLAIGRLSCDSETLVSVAVGKCLAYMQSPPAGSWYTHAIGAAQNDRAFLEDIHRICDFLGPDYDFFGDWNGYSGAIGDATDPCDQGYTITTAVNGYPDNYGYSYQLRITPPDPCPDKWKALGTGGRSKISAAINAGAALVFHRDHGGTSGWGTPSYNKSDVNGLVNGDKLPVVFSLNCLTGQFDNGDNFCEAWLRNPDGGAVAALGHQRVSYSGYNDCLHVGIMDAFWDDYSDYTSVAYAPGYGLGDMLNRACAAVLDSYGVHTYSKLTANMFHLLGDPALELRTADPLALAATHPSILTEGVAVGFTVTVTRDGDPCAGATVALVDADDYLLATTDAAGEADFAFAPTGSGPLLVTATERNSLPYQGEITVVPNQPPVADAGDDLILCDDGDDGSEAVDLDGSGSSDPDGSIVSWEWWEEGSLVATGETPTHPFAPGTHEVVLTVTDDKGATDDDAVTIIVLPDLRAPDHPAYTVPGLTYEYAHGDWNALPDFDALAPEAVGIVDNVTLAPRTRDDRFGFRFTGYLEAPTDGIYTLSTESDDGSRLWIGDRLIVDNDGTHAAQERVWYVGLEAGWHALTITYFEKTGGQELTVRWAGPSIAKEPVPDDRLCTDQPNDPPLVVAGPDQVVADYDGDGYELIALAGSATDSDGVIDWQVWSEGGTNLADTLAADVWLSTGDHDLLLTAADDLGRQGSDALTATVLAQGSVPTGWQSRAIGSPSPAGVATGILGQRFQIAAGGGGFWGTGDGGHLVTRQLDGDGSIVARVVDVAGGRPWTLAGVAMRDGDAAGARHAACLLSRDHGVAFRRRDAVDGVTDHTAGSTADAPRWLRLVRTGDDFAASESADGATWTPLGACTISLPAIVDVGLVVASGEDGEEATVVFDNVVITD